MNKLGKVICIPFAYKKDMNSGVNISSSGSQRMMVYLKNTSVALVSAKRYNKDAEVVFATNLSEQEIPEEIRNIFERENIRVITIPYDEFRFPAEYMWSLAFYKLCVLKHICNEGFEKLIYLDTDVYIQDNLESIWRETENKILLYDINHGLGVEDYKILCSEVKNFVCGGGGDEDPAIYYTLWRRIFCFKPQERSSLCELCRKDI